MLSSISLPGWLRPSLAITALAAVALGASGCNDQTLQALRADFDIRWHEDFGYDESDFDASVLAFGTVNTGEFLTIDLAVSNPGTALLDVCDMYLAAVTFNDNGDVDSHIRVEADSEISLLLAEDEALTQLENGQSLVIGLRYNPLINEPIDPNLHLVVKHELNWTCDEETGGTGEGLYIPILGEGFGEPQPLIYAKPDVVDFGSLMVGEESDVQDVVVGNNGFGLLITGEIELDDEVNFSLEPGTAANAEFTDTTPRYFHVSFHPQSQGPHSATVIVNSNDPSQLQLPVQLYGEAEPEEIGKGPQAICGLDYDSAPFQTVIFDGSASYDPDGLNLNYQWILNAPTGSAATLSSSNQPTTTVALDLAGDYIATLTVTNTNGQADSCDQTVAAIPNENFRVEMFWDRPDDMDLHLLEANNGSGVSGTPRGNGDCYYANTNPNWGVQSVSVDDPALDLDDIYNTGPENINIISPAGPPYDGEYQVFVHDYQGTVDDYAANDVTVNIYLNGSLIDTYQFQISNENNDYYVARIAWPSGVITACNGLSGC